MTRILYVEDNDDNVYTLKLRFGLLDGFEVLIAENGRTLLTNWADCARRFSCHILRHSRIGAAISQKSRQIYNGFKELM